MPSASEILLVEDSLTQAEQLKQVLAKHYARITVATNGREALRLMAGQPPALVISDVLMPEMDGYELCRHVKRDPQLKNIPVILLTSLADAVDIARGLECGADNFLFKPYEERYLLSRVAFMLANRQLRETEGAQMGVEVAFSGQKYFITSDRLQILNLLLSTYEIAVQNNRDLIAARDDLRLLNASLEAKVAERTAALNAEIVERRRVEEALRASEERFRHLAEQSEEGFWFARFQPEAITDVSPALEKMWGLPAAEFSNRPRRWMESIHVDDRPGIAAHFDEWRERRTGGLLVEFRVVRPDQTVRWVQMSGTLVRDDDGEVIRLGGIVRDITEARHSQDVIREQAALLDKARDAILMTDLERRILYWNKSAERLYGWSAGEVLGRTTTGLIYPVGADLAPIDRELRERGEWIGEVIHSARDGQTLQVEARFTLVCDERGKPKAILAINTDITEKKKIEAQFLRAQRLENIGTLASGIAHDLNNILAPILMAIDLLRLPSRGADDRERIHATIEICAKRGAAMVKQVLSFARGIEGHRVLAPPRLLIEDIVRIIEETFPKSIECEFNVARDIHPILADPTQVQQVLLNLCVNARDAMPGGGRLTLAAENIVLDEHYVKMTRQGQAGHHVVISVTDTGEGISSANLERIFDPFFTTKEQGKGTGLGLATVMTIVRGHGGFVEVHSKVGCGTTFKVYFPAEAHPAAATPTSPRAELPRGDGECVLVVDDEASVRTITQQTLEAFGYRVLLAQNGVEAISVFAVRKAEIAAVVCDMMMPVMDGPTTIRALKALDPDVRTIATSGMSESGNFDKSAAAGAAYFLPKPYTAEKLLRKLHEAMGKARSGSLPISIPAEVG